MPYRSGRDPGSTAMSKIPLAGRAALLLLAPATAPALAQTTPDTTDWHRYAPLRVGNVWQYYEQIEYPPVPGFEGYYQAYEVVGDTVVDGQTWFVVLACRRAVEDPPACTPEQVLYRLDEEDARLLSAEPRGDTWAHYPCRLDAPFTDEVVELDCGDGTTLEAWVHGEVQEGWEIGGDPVPGTFVVKRYDWMAYGYQVVSDVGLTSGCVGDPGCAYSLYLDYARLDGVEYGTPRIIIPNEPGTPAPPPPALTVAPNPLRGHATLSLALDVPQALALSVYDVRGRLLDTRPFGTHPAGLLSLRFDAAALAPGLYLLRLTGDAGFSASRGVIVRR